MRGRRTRRKKKWDEERVEGKRSGMRKEEKRGDGKKVEGEGGKSRRKKRRERVVVLSDF